MYGTIATPEQVSKVKGIVDLKVLTNSARSDFLNCRKKFQYNYVMGLRPRKLQIPFLVGGLFHDELEILYTAKWNLDEAKERITKAIEEAVSQEGVTEDEADKVWVQHSILLGMLSGYKQRYTEDKKWGVQEAEHKFLIDINEGWKYSGKVDLIILKGKFLFIVEHKTTSKLDQGYIARLPLDNQIIGYSWGVMKSTNKMPKGVIYNVTKKTQLRHGRSETFAEYTKRVKEDYTLNPDKYYYREQLVFAKHDLRAFQIELHKIIGEIERCEEIGFYYKNPTICTMYGKCEYMPLCINGINAQTLLGYYVRDHIHEELQDREEPNGKTKKGKKGKPNKSKPAKRKSTRGKRS